VISILIKDDLNHFCSDFTSHNRIPKFWRRNSNISIIRDLNRRDATIARTQPSAARPILERIPISDINHNPSKAAVGNSSPFLTNLPFHDFPNYFNHESWFTFLGKSCKGRFVKKGDELPTAGPKIVSKKLHRVGARAFSKCLADIRPSWTDYD
jgi:hypothetical protein